MAEGQSLTLDLVAFPARVAELNWRWDRPLSNNGSMPLAFVSEMSSHQEV